jgi:hypothetical protein
MAEQKAKKKKSESDKRMRKRFWFVAIAVLTLVICCYVLLKTGLLDFQTIDEQLAAIEAARAIPDAENAAIIYNQLLENYDESEFPPDSLSIEVRRQPWLSKDYPEGAEWLKGMQETISTLLEASKKEKCRFPLTGPKQIEVQMDRISAMRRWTRLLISAANNDIAEGRIDAGIQKYRSVIKMANHLCQQPVLLDYLVGGACEDLALSCMKTFILEGDVSEKHLKTIEAAIPQTQDNWAEVSSKIIEFESLFQRKNYNLFDRLKLGWQGMRVEDNIERMQDGYLRRQLWRRRGSRILIALRRYRNKNGRWPETLDGVKNLVPEEILVDPISGGSFVYKLAEENFTLYSKGENNIDEDGERDQESGADDWPIWPTSSRKTKKEKADSNQSNKQKGVVK